MEPLEQHYEPQRRPGGLTALGILTLITTGYPLLNILIRLIKGPNTVAEMAQVKAAMAQSINQLQAIKMNFLANEMKNLLYMVEALNANHYLNLLLSTIVYLVGVFGVIYMWRRNYFGFQLYIAYRVFVLILPLAMIGFSHMSILVIVINLIFSLLFIFLYWKQRAWFSKTQTF